jgi:hypothetical protein
MIVVLDADILSSLAKIKRLSLIKSLFPEYDIVVPSKIYEEILRCKKLGLNFVDEVEEVLGDWFGVQRLSRELEEKASKLKTEAGLGQDAILDGLINSSSHVRQIKADLKGHDYFEFKKAINQYLEELPTRIELKYS